MCVTYNKIYSENINEVRQVYQRFKKNLEKRNEIFFETDMEKDETTPQEIPKRDPLPSVPEFSYGK